MYTKFISKIIQEKLKAKERALSRSSKPIQDQEPDGSLDLKKLASRTTFARMCSNKAEVPNVLISGGENDENGMAMGFGKTYRDRTGNTDDGIEYGYRTIGPLVKKPVDNSGIRAIPGIKDIEVEYKGGFKALRQCTVNWIIPAIEDLDRLTPYFFSLGQSVVVDWGWVNAENKTLEEQGISPFITRQLNTENNEYTYNVDQDIFSNPQKRILESGGDYDAIGGIVSNFSYTLREDGGFDCTTIITSMGASLFHKPIDVSGNILGTRKQTLNGKLKYAPSDNLVNCVLNLRNIIMYDYLKVKREVYSNTVSDKNPAGVGHKSQEHKHLLTEKKDENTAKYMIYSQSDNVYGFKVNEKGNAYGLAVDDRDNPNVLVAIRPDDKEDIFVTWGWFEDQILNRYLSFNGGSEDGAGVKLTMRSIDTVLDENGKPISTQDLELGSLDFEEEDELVERYGVNLDIDQFNSVLKKPSVIRAPEMLYSIEPFKFFTVDIDLPKGKDNIKGLNTEKLSILETRSARIQKAIDIVSTITPATGLLRSAYKYITKDEYLGERGGKFYERFLNLLSRGNGFKDKVFKTPGTRQGVLRNVYMNIKEIQKAFGIKDPNNLKDTTQNNITPPGTIEVGVKNLLSALNSNFHNVWDFDLVVDQFDSTNIKVVDKSDAEVDTPSYTKYQENSHKVQDTGLYAFPSFKMGSIVKSQNLEFKIPSAQALSIMYGGNKKKGESDSGFNNSQAFDKLFRVGETTGSFNPYADKFLKDLETSNIEVEQTEDDSEFTIKTSPVGSQLSNHNAKITRQDGINITAGKSTSQKERRLYDWKVYSPELSAAGEEKTKGNIQEAFEVRVDDNNNKKILYITSEVTKDGASEISAVEKSFYEFIDGELVMKSGAQGALNSFLNASSPMSQFDMNSLIPSDLTLEVDGTGGFLPGDIIHTEYIQHKYKANIRVFSDSQQNDIGPLAYFQLFGITQKVNSEGWITELTSKMRINKLPVGIYRYNVPIDKPIDVSGPTTTENVAPPERQFRPVPRNEEDIAGDQQLENLEFEDIEEFDYIPVPEGNRPNIPVPMEEEDIVGDEDLEDLDFDDIPPWIPPSYPSTLALRRAKIEIENLPERVPDEAPPDVPLLDIGPMMTEEDFLNIPDNLGVDASDNNTDLVEYPPEPDPRAEPALPSQPIRRGGDYGNLNPLSLLDQIKSQKIIYVQPSFEVEKETGEIQKPQRFEAPQVQEVDYVSSPVEVAMAVNENIKKELPEVIEVETPQELNFIEPISTYKFQYEQNEILYALREDWRPLYQEADGTLSGARYKGKGQNRVENRLVRSGQPKEVRQAYWDNYIEGKNETGVSQTKFVDKDNFQIFPPVQPTGDLLRRERDTYWYGEFNPRYPLPPS